MPIPYEIIVLEVLPAARALIAKKLIENGLSQKEAAEKLGLTQPAISQYKRNLRGYRNDIFRENADLMEKIDVLTNRIMIDEIKPVAIPMELIDLLKQY